MATLAIVASLTIAAPAAAEDLTMRDARHDMVRVEEGGTDPRPAPNATIGDVVRSTFEHTDRRIAVRSRLAGLDPTGRRFTLWLEAQTGARRTWIIGVHATPAHRAGRTIFMDPRGRRPACALRHRVNYAADLLRVAVPTRCLHDPRVVRFRLLTEHVRRDWHYAWLDNGLAADVGDGRRTPWLAVG